MTDTNKTNNHSNHSRRQHRRNDITELVFILDRSGSMSGLEDDTVGGFNSMLEQQREQPGRCYVSTVLFSTESSVLHDRRPLEHIAPMTRRDYCVGGGTALYDAIGGAIHHIGNIHKYARPEDVPSKTVFIITTDGMENASRSYSRQEIRQMIRKEEERYGWEFIFLAANIDAADTAEGIGIRRERSANYRATPQGTADVFCCVNATIGTLRSGKTLDADWAAALNEKEDK